MEALPLQCVRVLVLHSSQGLLLCYFKRPVEAQDRHAALCCISNATAPDNWAQMSHVVQYPART